MVQKHSHVCRGELEQDHPKEQGVPTLDSPGPMKRALTVRFLCQVALPSLGLSFLPCEVKREDLTRS